MPVRLRAVTFEADNPARVAEFWAGLLGRSAVDDGAGLLLPGSDTQVGLRLTPTTTPRIGRNRVHLHVASAAPGDQERSVATALGLGATHLDIGQRPDEPHVVLADPEGNEFCVIEAGNPYMAGTGRLGEVACEGTRELGLFWQAALDWPLVWDRDEETAVQSPHGGTKVAWGGPPLTPKPWDQRQRLDLVWGSDGGSGDHDPDGDPGETLTAELDRLVGLGARRLGPGPDDALVLTDPDGNEFTLHHA